MLFLWMIFVGECVVGLQGLWEPVFEDSETGVLLEVRVLFRHGHRVPKRPYPNDPNANASLWKDGLGQLTNIGRRQTFELGMNLRSRYKKLIHGERSWRRVRTVSSDVSRTLMSAQVVLAGLLPPEGSDRWSDLDWQPAPVHTKPQHIDDVLVSTLPCPKYIDLRKNLPDETPPETKKMYDYLRKHSGKKMSSPSSLANLYTCLEIERQAGLNLPLWTNSVYPEPMKREAARALMRSVATTEMIRLRSGPLLKQILRFNENNTDETLRLYSTHDTVLSALLGSLKIELEAPPNFVSVVSVEYWKRTTGEIYVQLWWREGPGGQLEQLEWPGCGKECSLPNLQRILTHLLPKDWESECKMENATLRKVKEHEYRQDLVQFAFIMALFFSLVALPIYSFSKYQKRNRYNYEHMR